MGVRNKPEKIGMRKLPPCRDVGKTPRNAADKRLPFSRAKNFGKQSRKTFAPRLQKPSAQSPLKKPRNGGSRATSPERMRGKRASRYFAAFAISRTVASFDSKSEFSGKAIFWKPVFSW